MGEAMGLREVMGNGISWRRVVRGFPARRIPDERNGADDERNGADDERNGADGDCATENRPAFRSREQNLIIFSGFYEVFTIRADAEAQI
jgi:hypothetical protein